MTHSTHFRKGGSHAYMLCGWHTLSNEPLVSVPASVNGADRIDVHIQFATGTSSIGKDAGKVVFDHSAEVSRIGIDGVADFEVRKGRQIRVWPAAGAMQKDVEVILLGPAWAALCHQRGLLPLHASAILTGGGITAFAGHSGAGKSTIAALMGSLDYKLIADDILPVGFNHSSVPGAWPYLRRLKLRGDSISQLGISSNEQVSEMLDSDKYFVRPRSAAADGWTKLERLYLLEINSTDSRISIESLTGAEAVHALIDQTYHFQFINGTGRFREHLALCTRVASKVAIYRLRRCQSFDASALRSVVRAHLEQR